MRTLNRVILIGNLGKDPELTTLTNNVSVAKFSLATSESFTTQKGIKKTDTDWHNIVLWRGLAELAGKFLHKGSLICVEGKLSYRHYDDKDGNRHYVTEVVGDNLIMLDKKTDGA